MDQENNKPTRVSPTVTPWEGDVFNNFEKILLDIPAPIRGIAESRVSKKAESFALENSRDIITEKDMVDAFFAETPGGFLGPMTLCMEGLNIDYKKYGHK